MLKQIDPARKLIIPEDLKYYVDLNVDLGQSRDKAFFESTEYELLKYVTSVNIPCCVHDGDPKEMMEYIRIAKNFNCAVGAHLGLPDPANKGYQKNTLDASDLLPWIRVQMGAFLALAQAHAVDVTHVRPHGALYDIFVENKALALQIAETLFEMDKWLILIGPAGDILDEIQSEVGIRVAPEVYLGKKYTKQGFISKESLHNDLNAHGLFEQAVNWLQEADFSSQDSSSVAHEKLPRFNTFHISPVLDNAVEFTQRLYQHLRQPVPLPIAQVGPSGLV